MSFPPLKKVVPLRVVPMPDLEMIWRETCCEFLGACFNYAPKERLDTLARAMFAARDAMDNQ